MTVALFGTFDVANYGDALFPLLARRRLTGRDEELVVVSPIGGQPYPDALPSVGLDEFLASDTRVRAVVLGGGNLLHAAPRHVYSGRRPPGSAAYPALWLGAEHVARRDGAPLLWNAPGVPVAPPRVAGRHLRRVAEASALVAVRDEGSREHLLAAGVAEPDHVAVVPDPASGVADLWEADALAATFTDVCRARGRSPDERWVVLHASRRPGVEGPAALAGRFDAIAERLDASPLLLATGACHGDDVLLAAVAQRMETPPMVVGEGATLREMTSCLARAVGYVGASMHGAIVAAAYGVPIFLVPPSDDHKHRDLVARLHMPNRLRSSWADALSWITAVGWSLPGAALHVAEQARRAAAGHARRLAAAIGSAEAPAGAAPRCWVTDLLPPDLLLEMVESGTQTSRAVDAQTPRAAGAQTPPAAHPAGEEEAAPSRPPASRTPVGRAPRPAEPAGAAERVHGAAEAR